MNFQSLYLVLSLFTFFVACQKKDTTPQTNNDLTDGKYFGWHTSHHDSYGFSASLDSFYNDTLEINIIKEDVIEVFSWGNNGQYLDILNTTHPDSVVYGVDFSNYGSSLIKELIYYRPTQTITYREHSAYWSISGPGYDSTEKIFYQN